MAPISIFVNDVRRNVMQGR